MASIKVTNEQRDAATASAQDAIDAFEFGIFDEANAPVSPPLSGYTGFTAAIKQAIKDGIKQYYAIQARKLEPIGGAVFATAPSHTITSDTQLVSTTVTSFAPRKVMISLNLTAYTNVAATAAGFYVKVGASAIAPTLHYYFNVASDHRSMGGSWIATLPGTGATSITAWAVRVSGTGSIIMDSGDMVSLTIIG